MVKEYGYDSKYRTNFGDDNQYLLAFVGLIESQKPLLSFETPKLTVSPGTFTEEKLKEDTVSQALKAFPLYIPSEDQQGPQHQGYLPLCSYGGVHFKVLPASHAPGVEYALNSLHRLLGGAHLMYPIKYLKMIGKSGEGKGKEIYYQAAMEFGTQSLASAGPAAVAQIVPEDFSVSFMASVLFGHKTVFPEHLQLHTIGDKVHIKGFNVDDDLLNQMFKYYGGHSHGSSSTPSTPTNPNSPMAHTSDLNFLYTMPLMDKPIAPAVITLLTSAIAAPTITSTWLKDLHMQNRRYGVLKAVGFTPADLSALHLPISLPTHAAAQIQHLLIKVAKALTHAATSGVPMTHSDLLAALESGTAEKYAELRIQNSFKVPPLEAFETHRAQLTPATTSLPHGKATLTMPVDTMTAEVLNTLDFNGLPDAPELQDAYSALFDSFSYLPSLHLRHISESQLEMFFSKLLDANKEAYLRQKAFRLSAPSPSSSDKPNTIRTALRTAVKSLVLCGLTQQSAKALHGSTVVHAIQHELGIKVSFDVTLGRK